MSPEIWLALIGVLGALVAGLVYAIRKWADVKERQASHELDMQRMAVEHEHEIEERRDERERARAEIDIQTATYIATNTGVLQSLQKEAEAQAKATKSIQESLDRNLGNGLVNLLAQNADCTAQTLEIAKATLSVVQRIEERMAE